MPGTEVRAESSGARCPDQEAPADGRRDLPAVDPRIPVLEARLLDAQHACGRLHQCRSRLGQLGDQRGPSGTVRWVHIETPIDDLSRYGVFPTDDEILAGVRAAGV